MNNNATINSNKIKDESQTNKNGIKNLKADNLQKTIHKYLLENKYMTILPSSLNERKNISDMKNIKYIKKENTTGLNSLNKPREINNTNNNKRQLRSVNSCYAKKINKNIFNSFQVDNILNTISNNHNQRNKLNYNSSQENNTLKNSYSLKKLKHQYI